MKFDSKDFFKIYFYIEDMGYTIGRCSYAGDNKFWMDIGCFEMPLAGHGYEGLFTIQDDKVVCLEKRNFVMS